MVCCSAPLCSNSSRKGFRFFRFPSETKRRAVWLFNCRRGKWQPTDTSRLCEVHFTEEQFEQNRQDGRKLLKSNAIPTIFNFPDKPLEESPGRPLPKKRAILGVNHDQENENMMIEENSSLPVETGSNPPEDEVAELKKEIRKLKLQAKNMPRVYDYKGKLGKWNPQSMANAIKEVKERNIPLSTAARKFCVPRNTLRVRLTTGNVSNRQLGKGAKLNPDLEEQLASNLLLLDSKGFGLTTKTVPDKNPVNVGEDLEEERTVKVQNSKKRKIKDEKYNVLYEKALEVMSKPKDEFQIFGEYVASEIRTLKSERNRRWLQSEIRKVISKVADADDMNYIWPSSSLSQSIS